MKKYIIIFLLLKFCAVAQNFNNIPNASFENTSNCVIGYNYPYVNDWYSANIGSPDAFLKCMDDILPNTINDIKRHSGYNRVGIIVYDSINNFDGSEYIATKFVDTLKFNTKYCFSLYVIPAKGFKYGTDKLGAYFGVGTQAYSTALIPLNPQLIVPTGTFINDTADWYNFTGIYTAQGGESDVIIGNFNNHANTSVQVIDNYINAIKMVYLVIDDVSLHEMSINSGDTAVTCPQNMIATIGETNNDTAFKSYYWYDAAGVLFDSVDAQIQVQPLTNTFYVQEKRMCGQSMFDTVFVKIDTVCPPEPTTPEIELIIPNVFSPNGDGINDTWKIELPATYAFQSIGIYDRWGVQVATIPDLTANQNDTLKVIQWFGRTTSGIACSEGVYYYTLELKNAKGEIEKHKGYISLFR